MSRVCLGTMQERGGGEGFLQGNARGAVPFGIRSPVAQKLLNGMSGANVAKTSDGKNKRLGGLILLKDLVPQKDPKGGAARKTVFGEFPPEPDPPQERRVPERAPPKSKPFRP